MPWQSLGRFKVEGGSGRGRRRGRLIVSVQIIYRLFHPLRRRLFFGDLSDELIKNIHFFSLFVWQLIGKARPWQRQALSYWPDGKMIKGIVASLIGIHGEFSLNIRTGTSKEQDFAKSFLFGAFGKCE